MIHPEHSGVLEATLDRAAPTQVIKLSASQFAMLETAGQLQRVKMGTASVDGYLATTNCNGSVTGVGKLGSRISRSAMPGVSA